jgi:hypothetical protein
MYQPLTTEYASLLEQRKILLAKRKALMLDRQRLLERSQALMLHRQQLEEHLTALAGATRTAPSSKEVIKRLSDQHQLLLISHQTAVMMLEWLITNDEHDYNRTVLERAPVKRAFA